MEWSLNASDSLVKGEHYPRVWGTSAPGFYLPWDHSSLWLQLAAGQSWGDRDDTLANFYFGGFGNNWVDHGEVRRYRDYYSFPGHRDRRGRRHQLREGHARVAAAAAALPPRRRAPALRTGRR